MISYSCLGVIQFLFILPRKATSLDGTFAPGSIGYGNAYAAQEGDQAMSAYRTLHVYFLGNVLFIIIHFPSTSFVHTF